jgi:hypothetical protein
MLDTLSVLQSQLVLATISVNREYREMERLKITYS